MNVDRLDIVSPGAACLDHRRRMHSASRLAAAVVIGIGGLALAGWVFGVPRLKSVLRDTGQGISPAFLPRVFDRFAQGTNASSAHGGLGLGLAIVKHLVELHGGSISVESPGEGVGATFTVLLPAHEQRLQRRAGSA